MDHAISATDANQRFSEVLRDVQEGASFVVLSRGRAVARLIPVDRDERRDQVQGLLRFVESLPRRQAGQWTRDDLYA